MTSNRTNPLSRLLAGAALTLAALGAPAHAAYPDKPITLVVPFPAGGGVDLVARLLAQHMAADGRVNVVVENKAGAGGIIGVGAVARSAPDGYTIVLGSPGNTSIAPSAYPGLPYDPVKDLTAIGMVVQMPILLLTPPAAPYSDVPGLLAHARQNPGKLTYASGGLGTSLHLSGEMLSHLAGIDTVHVPYKGSTPALSDLMGGRVDYMFVDTSAISNVKAGRLKLLAVTSPERSALLPDTPTIAESGLPSYQTLNWYGLFGPAGLDPEARAWLDKKLDAALNDPAFVAKLNAQMLDKPPAFKPGEFADFVAGDVQKWRKLVQEAGLELGK